MGVKISELNEATSAQNSDVLPIVQNGETKKIQVETLGSQKVNKTGDTMTGDLNMGNNSVKLSTNGNIEWEEYGYGDKFRIIPDFTDTGSNNKLIIQSTNGDAGTDPTNWKSIANLSADTGDLKIEGKLESSNINTKKRFWGTSMSFTMQTGGHALVMLNATDCLMIWMGGGVGSESITVARLYGTEAQVTLSGTTVTVNFLNNQSFTGNVIII